MKTLNKSFTTQKYSVSYGVEIFEHNQRLDQFLKKHFESFSRESIKKFIANGCIEVKDYPGRLKPSTKLKLQDQVNINIINDGHEKEFWNHQELKLTTDIEIIYEHDDFLVINKPAFMSTHPTGKHLFNCVTVHLEEKYGHPFYSIHRLDRETSGVLIVGKNKQAPLKMTPMFEEKKVQKAYFFMAHNKGIQKAEFFAHEELYQDLDFIPKTFIHCAPKDSGQGKSSCTYFKILHSDNKYVLGLAFPLTGRQHQIRSHAYYHGMPLIGDKLYTEDLSLFGRFKDQCPTQEDFDYLMLNRHALHALSIKLPKYLNSPDLFISEIPVEFIHWIKTYFKIDQTKLENSLKENINHVFSSNILSNN